MAKSAREAAFQILVTCERDNSQSIDASLNSVLNAGNFSREDRAWVMELVYGITRAKLQMDAWIESQYKGPYRKAQHAVKTLLRMGLFQLKVMKTPDHAAINETVNLSRKVKQSGSAGLINAILRKLQTVSLEDVLKRTPDPVHRRSIETSHPEWLLRRWDTRYSQEEISQLCSINNGIPALWVRRNVKSISAAEFEAFLEAQGIHFEQSKVLSVFYRLDQSGDLLHTPEFKAGWFSYQDIGAGVVAHLVDPEPDSLVVDACAAPGGKMAYLSETKATELNIIACDASPKRLERVQENVDRLHLTHVSIRQLDASRDPLPEADRILLDVPCSGTGVLGRRPDSRWKHHEEDLLSLNDLQQRILVNAWKSLRAGGTLIYATCSLEPEENWMLIEKTLEQLSGAVIEPIRDEFLKPYIDERGALSTLPWKHDMDGMFAVRLRKSA